MIGEVISIGDELTSGQRLDTNGQWLSVELGRLGVRVVYHATVADDLAACRAVLEQAIARASVVVITGGLGPTADDLTREALAAATGTELVLDEGSLEHIRTIFARFGREMPQRNRVQAMFPQGSQPIHNPNGTAPGIAMRIEQPGGGVCKVFALPGVPAEMQEMFAASVAPAIGENSPGDARMICHRRIKCFGAGESAVEEMLPDLIRRGREPSVGITVHEATITLRVTAEGSSEGECHAAMESTVATIRRSLGELVFGEEDDELEDAVVRLLAERGRSLASAEVSTAGLLTSWLSRAAGKLENYRGAIVLTPAELRREDSPLAGDASAKNLAEEVRDLFCTDYGLAVGEFPAATDEADVRPEFSVALATPDGTITKSSPLGGHPAIWKPRAAKMALNLLRLALIKHTNYFL